MSAREFIQLAQSLSPVLFRMPLLGDLRCLDTYNRATTIVSSDGNPIFTRNKKGFYFSQKTSPNASTGSLLVVDSGAAAELRALSGTLFWTARKFSSLVKNVGSRIISKWDSGGVCFDSHIVAENTIALYDGTNISRMASVAIPGSKSGAIRYVSGAVPSLFIDGIYRVDGTLTVTPPNNDADVHLANLNFSGSYTYGSNCNDYGCFIIFNDSVLGRAITDQEIAQLHEAWESIGSIHAPKRTISLPRKATEIVSTAPLLHWAGPRTPSGLLPDLSGNGRDGTISGRVTQMSGPDGVKQVGSGVGDPLVITASDAALHSTNITYEIRMIRRGRGASNAGMILAINNNLTANAALACFASSAIALEWSESYSDGYAAWTFPVPAVGPELVHIILKHNRADPTTLPSVWVDGEAQTVTNTIAKTGSLTANAAPRISILNRGDVAYDFDGSVSDVKVYGSLLTDAECRALYLDHALSNVRRMANRTDYPISLEALVSAGQQAGPWTLDAGNVQWADDGTRRAVVSGAGGATIISPSTQAYGAWYFGLLHAANVGTWFLPLSTCAISPGVAGQIGYGFAFVNDYIELYQLNGAAFSVVFYATTVLVPGTEYEFFVTRTARNGTWAVWIRGGAYTTWQLVPPALGWTNPFVAALVTQSTFIHARLSINDNVSDVVFFPNGGTLIPTDVPWLK